MLKDKLCKLLNVKSIITICITIVFCVLSAIGRISPDKFMTIFSVIIAFYFGTQYEKTNQQNINY